jgi:transposase
VFDPIITMNSTDHYTPQNPKSFVATIGLDWADQKHDVWLRPQAGPADHQVIEHTPQALHEWVAKLRARFPEGQIALALETSRGALVYALMVYEFLVLYPINPKSLSSYREAFKVSGTKDDRSDARLLEDMLRKNLEQLRPLKPEDQRTRTLAGLTEKRRQLVDQRTAAVNECHAELKCYYPLAREILGDLTTSTAVAFLLKWPDLASLKKAGATQIRKFYYAQNGRSEQRLRERELLLQKAQALTQDAAIIVPARLKVKALAGMIGHLNKVIDEIDVLIRQEFAQHEDAFIFQSFPVAGPVLAPRLLVAFGTKRERFGSAQEISQSCGIAPVKRSSGKTELIGMRYRCAKFVRQTFHEHAACVVKKEPWARAYYQMLRTRGKGHHTAIRATAFKLIRIYFRCWKNRTTYDANAYLAALKKQGSPLSGTLEGKE